MKFMSPRRIIPNAAYTLLELSLVLVVLSLLAAGIIAIVTQHMRRSAMMEVTRKMDVIEARLLNFRNKWGYLPCPADSNIAYAPYAAASTNFGNATITSGNNPPCTNTGAAVYSSYSDLASDGGTPAAQAATFYDGSHTVAGDVPIKTLELSDDYMFDPWGGRFFYVVDSRMTTAAAFTNTYPVINASTNVGSISIIDGALIGGAVPVPPHYKIQAGLVTPGAGGAIAVLMSYGPDGHGAFQYGGGARKNVGNSNANTLTNCHCDNAAVSAITHPFTIFVQAPATSTSSGDPTSFDDIVRYYTRQSFVTSTDLKLTPTDPTTTR